jgi:hypothetical protein
MTGSPYRRRISTEEAREGYILVLKARLNFFPRDGAFFMLVCGGASARTRVEAVSCTCRGPETPHEHYFMRWPGMNVGQRIEIEQREGDDDGPPRYSLRLSDPNASG